MFRQYHFVEEQGILNHLIRFDTVETFAAFGDETEAALTVLTGDNLINHGRRHVRGEGTQPLLAFAQGRLSVTPIEPQKIVVAVTLIAALKVAKGLPYYLASTTVSSRADLLG